MHPHLVQGKQQKCGDLIKALEECHSRGMIAKFSGQCNDIKHDLNMCLREERIQRTERNRQDAKLRTERKEKLFKSIDNDQQ
ncbi:unnamed protein product [Sympodiomycopsis kandeliae]